MTRGEGFWVYILDTGIEGGLNHHVDLKRLDHNGCLVTHPLESTSADDSNFLLFEHGLAVAGVALASDTGAETW